MTVSDDVIDARLDEMFEGYRDGFKDTRDEVPEGTNRSDAYVFGWRNGRDDRKRNPRASADVLRRMGTAIVEADQ